MAQFESRSAKGDFFQNAMIRGLEWIAANRQTFFSVAGTAAAVLIIGIFTFVNFRGLRQRALDQLAFGRNFALRGDFDNAVKAYDQVLSQYARTPAATQALLAKGDVLFAQRKFPEAIDLYQQCLARNPGRELTPIVLSSLGSAQENSGQFDAASATYQKFFEQYSNHFYAPKMYESLARCYELTGNKEGAKQTYEKIITLYPNTPWVDVARIRYQVLSPAPFEGAAATPGAAVPGGAPALPGQTGASPVVPAQPAAGAPAASAAPAPASSNK